jgi:hypothetical protein
LLPHRADALRQHARDVDAAERVVASQRELDELELVDTPVKVLAHHERGDAENAARDRIFRLAPEELLHFGRASARDERRPVEPRVDERCGDRAGVAEVAAPGPAELEQGVDRPSALFGAVPLRASLEGREED